MMLNKIAEDWISVWGVLANIKYFWYIDLYQIRYTCNHQYYLFIMKIFVWCMRLLISETISLVLIDILTDDSTWFLWFLFSVSLYDTVDFHSLMDVYLSCCSFEYFILLVSCIYHLIYWYLSSAWNHAILHSFEFYPSLMISHDHIILIPSCYVVTVCCCYVDMYSSSSLTSLSCLIVGKDSSSCSC